MKKLIYFLFLATIFPLTGCAELSPFMLASPIVSGVVAWKQGQAHKYYNEESHRLYRATKTSLRELGLTPTKDERTKQGYYIVAGDQDRFRITIRQVKPDITDVGIRVNVFGDKPYAELVYRQIDANVNSVDFDDQGRPTAYRR